MFALSAALASLALSAAPCPQGTVAQRDEKPWKAKPGMFVALTTCRDTEGALVTAGDHPPLLELLHKDGTRPVVEAHASLEVDAENLTVLKLDLAAYKMNATEVAIGVRGQHQESFLAGESMTTTLTLFRRVGTDLLPIFQTQVAYDDIQRGPGDVNSEKVVITMGPKTTASVFDLQVSRIRTTESTAAGADGRDTGLENGTSKLSERYVWNGTAYQLAR